MAYVVVSRVSFPGDMVDAVSPFIEDTKEKAIEKVNREFNKLYSQYKAEPHKANIASDGSGMVLDFFDAGFARVSMVEVHDDQLQGFTQGLAAAASGL